MKTTYEIVSLPGDGIGPEVVREGLKVLEAVGRKAGRKFEVTEIPCGGSYMLGLGNGQTDWPEGSLERCKKADAILLGAVGWPNPKDGGKTNVSFPDGRMAGWSAVIGVRTNLDLYANVRPIKLYPGVKTMIHGVPKQVWDPAKVDMVIIRENTEGLYSGVGGIFKRAGSEQIAIDDRIITREGATRVIKFAFELAKRRKKGAPEDGKTRVTCVVKDNVLQGCKMFRRIFNEVGERYADIEKESVLVDSFTMFLMTKPEHYDVVVTTNMFGDIVTDLGSVLQGGMGMAVGANTGDFHAMFEPVHGTAPTLVGDKANPIATVLCVKELLEWLGARHRDELLPRMAEAVEKAVTEVLADGKLLTADLAAPGTKAARTSEVGSHLAERAAGLFQP
ncbi:MAG: isocitrate/isopropylmalate dehydrogenase family protein [Planctomycetota bacterium]